MKKIFALLALILISGCGDDYGDSNILFVFDSVYVDYYHQNDKVEVTTTLNDFKARGIGDCSWIDYKCDYPYVNVSVSENKSTEDRKCFIEVYNDKHNLRDTFIVYQYGLPAPVNGGNGGGSGVGGGSGTNETKRRCAARTKKGTRCKRYAAKGSIYCWQHKK